MTLRVRVCHQTVVAKRVRHAGGWSRGRGGGCSRRSAVRGVIHIHSVERGFVGVTPRRVQRQIQVVQRV
jgi:hypothetical protein